MSKQSLVLSPERLERALVRVRIERALQDMKWGEQNHSFDFWLAILMEEVGELAKAIVERKPAEIDAELTQVAAVAVAMMEFGDRKGFDR